jgi:uncharacterized protein (TIGR03067 family)
MARAFGSFGGDKMMTACLPAVLLGLLTGAAGDASDKARAKDLAAFQGQWRVRWVERDGRKVELAGDAVYTIQRTRWLLGDRAISSIAIDPGCTPKLLDLTRLIDDARKGFTMEGIYKIEGDTMVWCVYTGEGVKQRPQEFRAPPGWDGTVYHLTRVQRAKD